MEKTIIIRIGEIFLKGNNKYYFESLLLKNIKAALKGIDCKVVSSRNRMNVEKYAAEDECEIVARLKCVFGIHSISPAYKIATDLEKIAELAQEISPKAGIFRVNVNRADKRLKLRSMDIARDVGGYMLSKSDKLTVNLFEYDFDVNIDIRENGISYIFYERIPGLGGLPVGCSGNGMLLLSGGIDSPVAGFTMAKRGVRLFAVHYHSFPYTSEQAKEKVIDLAKKITKYTGNIKLFVVPFTEIQYAIRENCPAEFMITIMRRFMMRIAEKLAKTCGCGAIITGESLGQVASQTMESMNVTNAVVDLPVFRPLIGNDKIEIIEIAKRIDTYDLSILPYEDCCTVFLPKNPVIKPKLEYVMSMEEKLNIDALVDAAIGGVEIIETMEQSEA